MASQQQPQTNTRPPNPNPNNKNTGRGRGKKKPAQTQKKHEPSWFDKIWSTGPNPRSFDNLFSAASDVLDTRDLFDGVVFHVSRLIHNKFDIAHSIQFGSATDPAGYSFSAGYRDKGMLLAGKFFPAVGSVQGRIQYLLWKLFLFRITGKSSPQPGQSQLNFEAEAKYKDFGIQTRFHNGQVVEASYAQSIYKNMQAGILGFMDMVTGKSGWKAGLRYASKLGIWTASYANVGEIIFSYTQASERKRKVWSTEVEFKKLEGQDVWESIWSVGYMYSLLAGNLRGRIDSHLRASMIMEEKLNEAVTMLMCAEIDYLKDSYKIGFGLQLNTN